MMWEPVVSKQSGNIPWIKKTKAAFKLLKEHGCIDGIAKNTKLDIRPEYLKGIVSNKIRIEAPSSVSWKTCAHKSETTCLTFNREGDIIYTGGADGIIKGWRTSDGKETC